MSGQSDQPALPVVPVSARPDTLGRAADPECDVFIPQPQLPFKACAAARRLTQTV